MGYDVALVRTDECPTAAVRAVTSRRDFPRLWAPMLDEVWAFLRATPGLLDGGHNVMLYGNGGQQFPVEVGVQVTGPFEPTGRVVPSTLPAAEAATTVHTGPPAELGAAHAAVRDWCAARNRGLTGLSWEIYGDPDPGTGRFAVAVYWQLA